MTSDQSECIGDIPFFIERPNVYLISSLVDEVSRLSKWDAGDAKFILDQALICIDPSSDCFKSFSVSWLKSVGAQRTGSETSGISDG